MANTYSNKGETTMNENTVSTLTVDEFVDAFVENKDIAIEAITKPTYVPYASKQAIAQVMINKATMVDEGMVFIDTCTEELNHAIALLKSYTYLELTPNEALSDYDKLQAVGALTAIVNALNAPQYAGELAEFEKVWNNVKKDFKERQSDPKYYFATQFGRIAGFLDKFSASAITQFGDALDNLDDQQVENLLDNITKRLEKTVKKLSK